MRPNHHEWEFSNELGTGEMLSSQDTTNEFMKLKLREYQTPNRVSLRKFWKVARKYKAYVKVKRRGDYPQVPHSTGRLAMSDVRIYLVYDRRLTME